MSHDNKCDYFDCLECGTPDDEKCEICKNTHHKHLLHSDNHTKIWVYCEKYKDFCKQCRRCNKIIKRVDDESYVELYDITCYMWEPYYYYCVDCVTYHKDIQCNEHNVCQFCDTVSNFDKSNNICKLCHTKILKLLNLKD